MLGATSFINKYYITNCILGYHFSHFCYRTPSEFPLHRWKKGHTPIPLKGDGEIPKLEIPETSVADNHPDSSLEVSSSSCLGFKGAPTSGSYGELLAASRLWRSGSQLHESEWPPALSRHCPIPLWFHHIVWSHMILSWHLSKMLAYVIIHFPTLVSR